MAGVLIREGRSGFDTPDKKPMKMEANWTYAATDQGMSGATRS